MAYESRIIIANIHRDNDANSEQYGEVIYAESVMDIRLGFMGYNNGWKELFNKEIDFDLYVDNEDKATREDKYGDTMKEGDLETIINWLENIAPAFWGNNPYRRIAPLLGALKGFKPEAWDELHIVHYGY